MSRPGNPYDNAKADSFMKTLKTEEVNGKAYVNIEDAHRQICAFIETIYNRQRLHSALGHKPPVNHFGARKTRRPPHIYSAAEIDRLIEGALRLRPKGGLRSRTYAT